MAQTGTPSLRNLFWEFARAESARERFAETLRLRLTAEIAQALDEDLRALLSDFEWGLLALGILSTRWPMTLGPLLHGTLWRYDALPPEELGKARYVHMPDLETVAPSLTLAEFGEQICAGTRFPYRDEGSFGDMVRRRARDFHPAKLRGALILLSESGGPPYLLIEGLTRASALTLRVQRGETVPPTVLVLVGQCEDLKKWRFY